jgi:uncharacterized protein
MAVSMKLFVDRLTPTPQREVFEASPGWWRERADSPQEFEYEIPKPFRFEIDVHKVGADVIIEGEVSGEIEMQCGRCLARYRQALREEFRLVAEEASGRTPPDPEGEASLSRDGLCLIDEIESGWFQGSVIQLDGLFGEVLAGAIPLHPICREDCKGLCPQCGVSWNDASCDCTPPEQASERPNPFAALAQLKDKIADENSDA